MNPVWEDAFVAELNRLHTGWRARDGALLGPGGATIRFDRRHECGASHVDVEFLTPVTANRRASLWDCISGLGETPAQAARWAAHIWAETTARALLEWKYSGTGVFAAHYHSADPDAFEGWHAIHGGIIGYGRGNSGEILQEWWLGNPLLPILARVMNAGLPATGPSGLKILFGGDSIAEVRLDGQVHEAGTRALRELPWPRLEDSGFVRSYVILLHRE